MKHVIHEIIQADERFQELTQIFGDKNILITGLNQSSKALLILEQYLKNDKQLVIVTNNLYQADKLEADILQLLPPEEVFKFPVQDIMIEAFSTQSPDLMSERIRTLTQLAQGKKGLFIVPINGLKKQLTPKHIWNEHYKSIQIGDDIDLDEWANQLIDMGYKRQSLVSAVGEFSIRGGLIDIYPVTGDPVRIELFDTEVDGMRLFDVETQRSLGNVEQVEITTASDYIFTSEQISQLPERMEEAYEKTRQQLATEMRPDLKDTYQTILMQSDELKDHQILRRVISFMYDEVTTLTDYFADDALIVVDEYNRIKETEHSLDVEIEEFTQSLIESGQGFIGQRFISEHAFTELLHQHKIAYFTLFTASMPVEIEEMVKFSCKPVQRFYGQYDIMQSEFDRFMKQGFTVVLLAESETRKSRIQSMLNDMKIPTVIDRVEQVGDRGQAIVTDGALSEGFELPYMKLVVVTEKELFKARERKQSKRRQKLSNAEKIKSYQELNVGDYVVHVHHGVGKYLGVETLEVSGIHKDYIKIQYKGTDQLFVPVDQMNDVQKFVGSDDKEPKVNKLGGTEWKKTKAKVQKNVEDIADELLKLYQEREQVEGYQYGPDTEEQMTFEMDFPYEPTPDQVTSLEEIKADMEKRRSMDRLLCGDVGYGKTEVAIRAAFKAVLEGKQVAVLVPTTILAQQHFETFRERMQEYPVEIQMMSRFRTPKQVKETKAGIKSGFVDIVVGTHKLLSKDVEYKDLGLLIVDEEQRFGVKHKERIKALKTNVDVLTLTATPIPRTLHMSLLGVRDLSVIETPPENRFPVQTYVLEQNMSFVKEALERELSRGGQAFYLYNRVQSIYQKSEQLSMLMPNARIGVAHGQMTERELEETMLNFVDGEYDILVTTTIIETGVDVPNANTLIIEDANRFGLSQLYQLRGRVGRSSRIGYAYFLHEQNKVLTEVAEQRLQAIKEFTELGSGFKIAMRDLNIRGAGNLLGSQQHGFIDSVGYDLYSQMLEEAVNVKRGIEPESEVPQLEVDIKIDAYIPAEYIKNEQAKIEMYKKLRSITTQTQLEDIQDELIDRFGEYPVEVQRLLDVVEVRLNGIHFGITEIKEVAKVIQLTASEYTTNHLKGDVLFKVTEPLGRKLKIAVSNNQMVFKLQKSKQWLDDLKFLTNVINESLVDDDTI